MKVFESVRSLPSPHAIFIIGLHVSSREAGIEHKRIKLTKRYKK